MSLPDTVGTVRRAPEGFAHAILLDQFGEPDRWLVIDAYGPMREEDTRSGLAPDSVVESWPVVYTPTPDEEWSK